VSRPAQRAVSEQPPQIEDRQYIGPNGELITIRFVNGKPQQEVPAGFKVYKPEEAVAPTSPVVTQPTTTGGDGGDGGGDNRESYDNYRSNMDKLSALDEKFGTGKFSEEWNNSVHKQQGFSLSALNVGKNIADDIARGALADKVITDIAGKYGLDPSNFKQKGLGKLQPGEYDVDSFLRSASAAPAPTLETNTGRPSGFLDENTYVDSSGDVRDVTAKSAQTKAGLEIESSRPSTTPIGYDDTEDEARNDRGGSSIGGTDRSGKSAASSGSFAEAARSGTYDDSDYDSPSDNGGGLSASPGDVGDTPGSGDWGGDDPDDWNKGGAVLQTERALKSSRKKK